jgi:hypothetical protein
MTQPNSTARTTRLWRTDVEVVFAADDVHEANDMCAEITGSILEHEAVWNVEGSFDPEQPTETVDA